MKSSKNSVIRMLTLPALVRGCFEVGTTAAGCALLLAVAGAAQAQGADPAAAATAPAAAAPAAPATQGAELEAITVMGSYERSLVESMDAKRNSTSIIEAVSAEDIGKLPDSSIAEAISRLPGLAGQRVDGRQNSISVRGFGEDFSATTFNGREQVSISDNRSVEFDVYPAEIMSAVHVYKTPDASLISQGIGGTVDLRTVRPLEAKKSIALSADYEKTSFGKLSAQAKDTGARGTFSYVDKFDDNKLGVALAISGMDSPNQEQRWQTWGYANDSAGNAVLGGAKPFVRSSDLKRNTAMGVLEFAPTGGLKITGDALYIDYKDHKILKGIEIPGAYGGSFTDSNIVNGFANSGVFNGRDVQVRNDYEEQNAKLKTLGLNAKYDLDKDWTLEGDLNYGQVSRDIFSLESYAGLGRPTGSPCTPLSPGDNIGFNMSGGNLGALFSPTVNYADPNLIHLGGAQCWGNGVTVPSNAQDGFINYPHVNDKIKSLKLIADKAIAGSFVSNVELGFNYTERTKDKQDRGEFLTLKNYPGVAPVPAGYQLAPTSLAFIGMGNMLTYDSYALYQSGFYNTTSENLTVATRALNTWSVNEKVSTLFAKADVDSQIEGIPVVGNFGAQVVSTNQSSSGFDATNNSTGFVVATPVSSGATYTKVLPSLNLVFKTASDQDARLGIARTMSRSRMDRENASFGYSFDQTANTANSTVSPWSGTFSNTALRPQMSDQLDLGYSWYYRKDAFVSAAAFYKHLTDWQVQSNQLANFAGFTTPNGQTLLSPITTGMVNQWVNSSKSGYVRGVEFQGLFPGAALSPVLDGFGLSGSATFLSSAISLPINGQEVQVTVPGLSNNIFNLTAYYEKHGFSVRFSGNKRSDFLGEEPATSFQYTYVIVKQTQVVDAQVSYSFEEWSNQNLKGLTVTFQVGNLTNEPLVTYYQPNDPRTVRDYQNYGRDYLLGLRYKF